jgi:ABC-2 type transport system permease protein/sodium transport system permease protein
MSVHRSSAAGLGRLARLVRKELSESLRDRRTLLTLVLMPLLLYPLLAIAFQQVLLSHREDQTGPVYRIGFVSKVEEKALARWWEEGRKSLEYRDRPKGAKTSEIPELLAPLPELHGLVTPDVEEAVRLGEVDVGVRLRPPGGLKLGHYPRVECRFLYRHGSATGREAVLYLERLTMENNRRVASVINQLRVDPVRVRAEALPDETEKRSPMLPVLVPLILILMTMTGAVYPAIDLTAGERERGTLEVLVAAPIPRLSVLLAKYVAVLTVAMLTALVNLGMMFLTLHVTDIGTALFGVTLGPLALLQVLGLLLLFAAFFSAVLLALTSFARTFKEAQAYLIPLMLLCLLPGVLALVPGLSLNGPLAIVPLLNIVLLSRDLLAGAASPAAAGVVVITTGVYAVAAVALAARIFGIEAFLSSEQSGWADLLRRPAQPRPTPGVPAALLCLALMFPLYFVLTTALGRQRGLPLEVRLGLSAAGNVLLFAGLPLALLWFVRARPASSLRWRRPGLAACGVAVLLGASLWPWAQELVLLLRQAGLGSLGQDYFEQAARAMAQWREVSPAWLVLSLAVVPAVLEELFFRGLLFSALAGPAGEHSHAGRAIAGSAVLFALFHVLVPGGLAVERLVSSLALGLVLGALAWASGSVLPGMLLHLLHNGLVVLAGYYEPQLIEAGWLTAAQKHLPAWLLASSGATASLGLAVLGLLAWRQARAGTVSVTARPAKE